MKDIINKLKVIGFGLYNPELDIVNHPINSTDFIVYSYIPKYMNDKIYVLFTDKETSAYIWLMLTKIKLKGEAISKTPMSDSKSIFSNSNLNIIEINNIIDDVFKLELRDIKLNKILK